MKNSQNNGLKHKLKAEQYVENKYNEPVNEHDTMKMIHETKQTNWTILRDACMIWIQKYFKSPDEK